MTDQHPLTDDICDDLSCCKYDSRAPGDPDPYIYPKYFADDMRYAADWQLEQVAEFLRNDEYLEAIAQPTNVEEIIDGLKAAMRPTTQENN